MKTFTLTTLVASAAAFKDGNPRGWDRSRRCDDDYGFDPDPRNPFDMEGPCGLCDGVGGEVWGDEKNDFVATPCVPIADSTEVQPVAPAMWGGAFTVELEEIMINECDENGQFPSNLDEARARASPQCLTRSAFKHDSCCNGGGGGDDGNDASAKVAPWLEGSESMGV